jgi:hypothetical protein
MTQQDIQKALAEPFPADAVGWKVQTVAKDQPRALAVAYIDARCVIDRLNAVVGLGGWQDAYDLLPDGCVVCRLSVRIDGEWVTKVDVGGESDQSNGGDKRKAAFSDSLKRAAVKFGVARYLYDLPGVWCDYDPKKKQLAKTPALPAWASPRSAEPRSPAAATVSGGQLAELERLLKAAAADRAKFLAAYGIDRLEAFPADAYDKAVSQLQRKIDRKAVAVRP